MSHPVSPGCRPLPDPPFRDGCLRSGEDTNTSFALTRETPTKEGSLIPERMNRVIAHNIRILPSTGAKASHSGGTERSLVSPTRSALV